MNKVIDIRKPKIDVDTIAAIEELLEKAKSGDLKSLMYVDKYHNGGGCGYGWAGTPDHQMVGKLMALQHMFIANDLAEEGE